MKIAKIMAKMSKVPHQKDCDMCGLRYDCKQVVVSDGLIRPNSFVAIGEAPGENEDNEGVPFVGRSGQLLRSSFKKYGKMNLGEEIPILNTVSCHPPFNRRPSEEEIEACHWWLRRNLAIINPRFVIAVGRIAAMTFVKGTPVLETFYPNDELKKEWRGGFYNFYVYMIWHPSYILRAHRPDVYEKFARMIGKFACSKNVIHLKNNSRFRRKYAKRSHQYR